MGIVSILFSIAAVQLLAAASPGPTFVIVSRRSIGESRRRGLLVVCGVLLADLSWAVLAASGLGVLVVRYPAIYTGLQIAGAAYLIWLGGKMLIGAMRRQYATQIDGDALADSASKVVRAGFLTNMTNPKSIAYYTSLFIVMIPAHPPVWLLAAAVGTAVLVSAAWWTTVALFFAVPPLRRTYERARRGIEATMGGVLVCLGVRLAISR
ncbi:MAG: LysE family transporter [Rhizomicrobium sp.]|jgi:threonine efflux protein